MKNLKTIFFYFILSIYFTSCNDNKFHYTYNENGVVDGLIISKDTLNSDRVYWYETGEFFGINKFKNGKLHGDSYFFHKSGNMKSHWVYFEGHPDGHCYNYGDSYEGYPMEFRVFGGKGQLVYRVKYDSTGKIYSEEGGIPKEWLKKK
jgi:antitoxin component YwqK of YwqJK toxin-antitoxin module